VLVCPHSVVPHGDFEGDIALLPPCGGGGEGTVRGEGADGQVISLAGDDFCGYLLDKLGRCGGDRRTNINPDVIVPGTGT
jgi:hypothetical protein